VVDDLLAVTMCLGGVSDEPSWLLVGTEAMLGKVEVDVEVEERGLYPSGVALFCLWLTTSGQLIKRRTSLSMLAPATSRAESSSWKLVFTD
jgi:hypothetical protein